MSEAIIVKRGSSNSDRVMVYSRDIIINSSVWEAPQGLVNNSVYVELIGGGGFTDRYTDYKPNIRIIAGGAGGYFNNGTIEMNEGEAVYVYIGRGGFNGARNGGTTSFGSYLSANGGGGGTVQNGDATIILGGDGGSGGGATISELDLASDPFAGDNMFYYKAKGGIGYQFGGGGVYVNNNATGNFQFDVLEGGDGGPWGGGGGVHSIFNENLTGNLMTGIGGEFGGNGGTLSMDAVNGTNTLALNLNIYGNFCRLNGNGRCGNYGGGGGGYGGRGGNYGGGGGGYGGIGGSNGGGGGGMNYNSYGAGGAGLGVDMGVHFGEGGSYSSQNGTNGACVIYYYRWINNGEQIGI